MKVTRGERNLNPCNLRYVPSIHWLGLDDPPQDADGYCRFTSPLLGLRAGALDLHTAIKLDGLDTVPKLIGHFAPPSENDTEAYEKAVLIDLGIGPDDKLNPDDPAQMQKLLRAIVFHENGRCNYADGLLAAAVQQALPRIHQ